MILVYIGSSFSIHNKQTLFLQTRSESIDLTTTITGTPNTVSFMTAIASTSGRLHSEFVRRLFFQAHRETHRFFADSGVQLAQTYRGQFHFRRAAFDQQLKSRVGHAPSTHRFTLKV